MKRSVIVLLLAVSWCVGCRERPTSTTRVCVNSLRIIAAAKDQAVLAHGWTNGTPCDTADARSKLDQFVKKGVVACPQGDQYAYNPIGVDPTCSLGQTNVTTVRYGWFKRTETRQHRLRK